MPWSLEICSTQCSLIHQVGKHSISNQDTYLYLSHKNSSVHLTTTYMRCSSWITDVEWLDNPTRLYSFILDTGTRPPGMTLPRKVWVPLNHLCAGVEHLHHCLHKWGMVSSAAVSVALTNKPSTLLSPMSNPLPPYGLHGVMALDDETIKFLPKTCSENQCGLAAHSNNLLKR